MSFEDLHRPPTGASVRGAVRVMLVVSAGMLVLQTFLPGISGWLGLVPVRVLRQGWVWQTVTYVFLHGGIFHWLFNMFVFWMFGRELEVRWGTAKFVRFCLLCAIGAAATVLAVAPHSSVPTIGSSGIVFGLLAAFARLFPNTTMYLYFVIPLQVWQMAALLALIELLTVMSGGHGPAPWAHLGGMAVGYVWSSNRVEPGIGRWFKQPWIWLGRLLSFGRPRRRRDSIVELTDDLAVEVDQILEKILKQGVDKLTAHEKDVMNRYAKRRR